MAIAKSKCGHPLQIVFVLIVAHKKRNPAEAGSSRSKIEQRKKKPRQLARSKKVRRISTEIVDKIKARWANHAGFGRTFYRTDMMPEKFKVNKSALFFLQNEIRMLAGQQQE